MTMNGSRALAIASVPAAAGIAWQRYRRALRTVETHPAIAPDLPGERRAIATSWGSATYRFIPGDLHATPLVLVHGWGRSGDSVWWPIAAHCDRRVLIVDLPGHGHSNLDVEFSFELAANAIERAVVDAGVDRPILIGHSMGGPVALTAVRRGGADRYAGVMAVATSAVWVRPRIQLMMALAPYAMAPRSPFLVRTERRALIETPDVAHHIAWSFSRRPSRMLLRETAMALRGFDSRAWEDLEMPPAMWIVASRDTVIDPAHQLASARHFDAEVREIDASHSVMLDAADEMVAAIESFAESVDLARPRFA